MIVLGRSSYERLRECERLIGNARILRIDFHEYVPVGGHSTTIEFEGVAAWGSVAANGVRLKIRTNLSRRDRAALAMLIED